jgi:hypothetical protein
MSLITTSTAAATAVLGYDLLRDEPNATIAAGERVTAAALKGSAAAGDSAIRLSAGNVEIGTFYNSATGFPNNDDMMPVNYVHRGAPTRLYAKVTDAPATSPLNLSINKVP